MAKNPDLQSMIIDHPVAMSAVLTGVFSGGLTAIFTQSWQGALLGTSAGALAGLAYETQRKKKRRNPRTREREDNPGAVATLAVIALIGAGGYAAYRATRPHALPGTGNLPLSPGTGNLPLPPAPTPDQPYTPEDPEILALYRSPYMTGEVSYDPGASDRPFAATTTVQIEDDSQVSGTEYFNTEAEATAEVKLYQNYFGTPLSSDDIFVLARDGGYFQADAKRGAVWQDAGQGGFYYSFVYPAIDGSPMSTHSLLMTGIDQAEHSLVTKIHA